MFGRFAQRISRLINPKNFTLNSSKNLTPSLLARSSIPLSVATYYAFFPASINLQEDQKQKEKVEIQPPKPPASTKKVSWLRQLWEAIIHILRFFQLVLIFTPPILLFPLSFFKRTEAYWRSCFIRSVERAGVVFIKAFQYMSHRRDIIGAELATQVEYLRENAPQHSWETTKEYFRSEYGKNIQDIFQDFEKEPIASGSVSQVYRAKYKGKKVAVKVRHPGVHVHIQRDINLLFWLSYMASFLWPGADIPISQDSLKRTLTDQIDFTYEMQNLNRFNEMFKERWDINFPFPFAESTKDMVLVETFVQGVPVTYYERHRHPLNKVIARLGSSTFFQMLMKNNFIHADCHGGNIMIELRQKSSTLLDQAWQRVKEFGFRVQTFFKSYAYPTQKLKKLYLQSREQELNVMQMLRKAKQMVVVNLIDVGMVIELNDTDKRNFVNFIKSVIEGRSHLCAEMIYNLSNFQGKKIIGEVGDRFKDYYDQLAKCFSILDGQELADLEGIQLFRQMLSIIRQHRMKLDGQFATLLTNMIVLQAIAKDIDPDINILKIAFPYFKYVEDFGIYSSSKPAPFSTSQQ